MAVILPGALISDIRGRVADLVFERNAGGLYVRSKGTVTQDPSDPRTAAKNALGICSTAYRTQLDDEQRSGWSTHAALYPDLDRWGRPKARTGQQAFISFNFHPALAFEDIGYPDPPTAPPLPKFETDAQGSIGNNEIDIACPWSNWPTPGQTPHWYIYQGQMINPTRRYYSGPYRFAGAFAGPDNDWPDFIYVTPVFTLEADKAFYIRIFYTQADPQRNARPVTLRALTV